MEQLDYNLLFRWFVGLNLDDPVWDVTVFTKNRERLLKGDIARAFFEGVVAQAQARQLLSAEHFTVDGTLLGRGRARRASAARTSRRRRPMIPATRPSTFTASGARMPRIPPPPIPRRSWPARVRGTKRTWPPRPRPHGEPPWAGGGHVRDPGRGCGRARGCLGHGGQSADGATLGADKGYDTADFVAAVRASRSPRTWLRTPPGAAARLMGGRPGIRAIPSVSSGASGWRRPSGGPRPWGCVGRCATGDCGASVGCSPLPWRYTTWPASGTSHGGPPYEDEPARGTGRGRADARAPTHADITSEVWLPRRDFRVTASAVKSCFFRILLSGNTGTRSEGHQKRGRPSGSVSERAGRRSHTRRQRAASALGSARWLPRGTPSTRWGSWSAAGARVERSSRSWQKSKKTRPASQARTTNRQGTQRGRKPNA